MRDGTVDVTGIVERAKERLAGEGKASYAAQARTLEINRETWRRISRGENTPDDANLQKLIRYVEGPRPESWSEALLYVVGRVEEVLDEVREMAARSPADDGEALYDVLDDDQSDRQRGPDKRRRDEG